MSTAKTDLKRRDVLRWGVAAAAFAPALASEAVAQVFRPADAEKVLFPTPGLPGGGQMEIRMAVSGEHPDPDLLEVSRRLKPYDPESYYAEFQRVAGKNQALAEQFEREGRKVTAHEFYLRAANFYRGVVVYMAETDPRMLPAYRNLEAMFNKAWSLVPPPFEQVQIPYEGHTLDAHFYPARTPPGRKMPVVYSYGGADGILLGGETAGGEYRARGMAYLAVDGPGQGGTLRVKKLYAPPDSERVAKAVVDYLVSRLDVDANRIAIHGSSMAGYNAPRCVTAEKRLKACAVWSGAFSLREDIFDYYPPIQDRLRWLVGARDLVEARKKIAEFTLQGRARQIECPLFVGYSLADRIMDPRGALRLYNEATNAKERVVQDGVGHGGRHFELRTIIVDWLAKQLGTLETTT